MSDIPDSSTAIQIEGARFRAAVSEALIQSIGGLANFLRKVKIQYIDFNYTGGVQNWIVTPGTTLIGFWAIGGGGGGGGGHFQTGDGGEGGQGSSHSFCWFSVLPGDSVDIFIGGGGAGGLGGQSAGAAQGAAGSAGASSYLKVNGVYRLKVQGGLGGNGGLVNAYTPHPIVQRARVFAPTMTYLGGTQGKSGSVFGSGDAGVINAGNGEGGALGGDGGTGGAMGPTGNPNKGMGGGGGGGSLGAGGAGGNAGPVDGPGTPGGAGGLGAGGGGGGGGGESGIMHPNAKGGTGGAGGNGLGRLVYFGQ